MHNSVILDYKRLVVNNLSRKLHHITLLPYRCVHFGMRGEQQTETSSQPASQLHQQMKSYSFWCEDTAGHELTVDMCQSV
jgi:hypothetical protein